jgi:phosphohistidine phosphatase SixA
MKGEGVLESLAKDDWRSPAAIMVRHAARHPVLNLNHSLVVGLTDQGKIDAKAFGSRLRNYRSVRLFHSPAVRCRETAEGISMGMQGNGTNVMGIEETWSLCAPYLKDERILRIADDLGEGFMRVWFNGELDERSISHTPEAADIVLRPVLERLSDPDGRGRLDVHVSHDWELVLLREELLGLRYEGVGWVEYLDGIVLYPEGDGFNVSYREKHGYFTFSNGQRFR